MKAVPNSLITALVRHLTILVGCLDRQKVKRSLRATNALRLITHEIIPKLQKIDKEESL